MKRLRYLVTIDTWNRTRPADLVKQIQAAVIGNVAEIADRVNGERELGLLRVMPIRRKRTGA